MKKILSLLGIALAFGSCSQDIETPENNGQEIRLTSFIQPQAQTRGANLEEQSTLINNGQSVGVTITGASAVHQNVEWISDGSGNLTNTSAPIYYKGTSAASIIAYHPFNAEWTDLAGTYTFNVATDQSGEGYANSDLLYATQTTSSTALTTNLAFSHKMAKIGVSLTVSDGSDLSSAEISITNTSTEATVNLSNNGIATCTGNSVSTIKAGEGSTAAAIIVPQTLTAGTKLISVSFNGLTYTYALPAEKNFEAGKSYLFRLRINNKELTFDGSEVNDWDKEETEGDMDKEENPLAEYLNFLAEENGCTVSYKNNGSSSPELYYSLDKNNWVRWSANNSINLNEGEKVYVKGNYKGTSGLDYSRFYTSGRIAAGGNIMSLSYGDDFKDKKTIETAYCFEDLFHGTSITTAPILPATTLAANCYHYMFAGCTNLVSAPNLPATILVNNCYASMFTNCTSLVTAPELPATTLAFGCYYNMFSGCVSIVTAPELPATTLVPNCYSEMFTSCSSLNSVKVAFIDWDDTTPTNNWFGNVASTGTFICPSSLNAKSISRSASTVPSGWTIVYE